MNIVICLKPQNLVYVDTREGCLNYVLYYMIRLLTSLVFTFFFLPSGFEKINKHFKKIPKGVRRKLGGIASYLNCCMKS